MEVEAKILAAVRRFLHYNRCAPTYEDIAQATGYPIRTVRHYIMKAMVAKLLVLASKERKSIIYLTDKGGREIAW